jgi:hypothetical protein
VLGIPRGGRLRGLSRSSAIALTVVIIIVIAAVIAVYYKYYSPSTTAKKPTMTSPATTTQIATTNVTQTSVGVKEIVLRVATPPDPNSLPLLLLKHYERTWLNSSDLRVTIDVMQAPGGDPSAMRALIHGRKADVVLFNFLGAAKFYSLGEKHIRICGVHVWRGVYILTWSNISDWGQLNGAKGIAVPGINTPPHIWAVMVLKKHNVTVKFTGMGPGSALFSLLSDPERAPKIVVAPEPLASLILLKEKAENWPIKYKVFADTAKEINPKGVPLGAVNLINPDLLNDPAKRKAVELFIKGIERAINCLNNPPTCNATAQELSKILAQEFYKTFGMKVPPKLFEIIISQHRIGYDYRPSLEVKNVLLLWLQKFKINVDDKVFMCPISR